MDPYLNIMIFPEGRIFSELKTIVEINRNRRIITASVSETGNSSGRIERSFLHHHRLHDVRRVSNRRMRMRWWFRGPIVVWISESSLHCERVNRWGFWRFEDLKYFESIEAAFLVYLLLYLFICKNTKYMFSPLTSNFAYLLSSSFFPFL